MPSVFSRENGPRSMRPREDFIKGLNIFIRELRHCQEKKGSALLVTVVSNKVAASVVFHKCQ